MIELDCKAVQFYSSDDEASFFSWAESISAVSFISGTGPSIRLAVKRKSISDRSLRELIGLFQRYNISMRQLCNLKLRRTRGGSLSPAPSGSDRRSARQAVQPDRERRRTPLVNGGVGPRSDHAQG
jgi:hypothetical protein